MSGRWDGRGREGVVLLLCLHLLALAQFWGTQHYKSPFFLALPACYCRVSCA